MNDGTETPGGSRPHAGEELARPRAAGHGGRAAKPKRASRGLVRFWAWTLGAISFLSPFALLGLSPKPAEGATPQPSQRSATKTAARRPVVVVVTKKIIYTESASSSSSVSSSGGGPVQYVQAPAAPPAAVSCGTHPC